MTVRRWTWRRLRMPTSPTRRGSCLRRRVDGTREPSPLVSWPPLVELCEPDWPRSRPARSPGAARTQHSTKHRIRHSARRRRLGRCGRMRTDRTRLSNWYATAARRTGFATGSERGRRRSSRRTRGYPNRRAIYPRRAVRGDVRRREATTNRVTRNGTRVTTRWLAPHTRR